MSALGAPPAYASVPAWARAPQACEPDPAGAAHLVLVTGDGPARELADRWLETLTRTAPGVPVQVVARADGEQAALALGEALAGTRVGVRVLVAGDARACLAVRAAAQAAGLLEEEVRYGVVDTGRRAVWCSHCDTTTVAAVGTGDVQPCEGCGRRLVVYPHISRRTGAHLGFMVDAEEQPWQ